jgi:hypothetical protein
MAAIDVTQKAEIYERLSALNREFLAIVQHLRALQQTGLFKSKATKLFGSFAQELQAEINQEFLGALEGWELDDWYLHGKVRAKWEKYLRGPEPKERSGSPRHKSKKRSSANTEQTK